MGQHGQQGPQGEGAEGGEGRDERRGQVAGVDAEFLAGVYLERLLGVPGQLPGDLLGEGGLDPRDS